MAQFLGESEILRYSRHFPLPGVGVVGQARLKAGRVLLVGTGGLGSPAALYLAAAGVGTLGLVDFDRVDLTNLHRQILHGTPDVGRPKLESAVERLRAVNPHVILVRHDEKLTAENALAIGSEYDVIVDGSDNFPTRYLVNDAAVLLGKPYVYGSIHQFEGQVSVFGHPSGPCYRCLFREPPPADLIPNCDTAGVFGVVPGIVGTLQATEVLKLLLGIGDLLVGRLLLVDTLRMRFRTLEIARDPGCPACGTREIRALGGYGASCGTATAGAPPPGETILPEELAARLAAGESLQLLDVREPYEWDLGHLPSSRHTPLKALPDLLASLDPGQETVVYCKTGVRSRRAATLLRAKGFRAVRNLQGGIMAWRDAVDPALPRY